MHEILFFAFYFVYVRACVACLCRVVFVHVEVTTPLSGVWFFASAMGVINLRLLGFTCLHPVSHFASGCCRVFWREPYTWKDVSKQKRAPSLLCARQSVLVKRGKACGQERWPECEWTLPWLAACCVKGSLCQWLVHCFQGVETLERSSVAHFLGLWGLESTSRHSPAAVCFPKPVFLSIPSSSIPWAL